MMHSSLKAQEVQKVGGPPSNDETGKKIPFFQLKFTPKEYETLLKNLTVRAENFLAEATEFEREVDSWTDKAHLNFEKRRERFTKEVEELEETKRNIVYETEKLVVQNEEFEKEKAELSLEIEKIAGELESLKAELEGKEKIRVSLEEQFEIAQSNNNSLKEDAENITSKRKETQQKVAKMLQAYERILGIRFAPNKGSTKCIFTHIDSKQHNKEFSFVLVFDKGKISVKDMSHEIPSIDTLVSLLNTDKDLPGFLKRARTKLVEQLAV